MVLGMGRRYRLLAGWLPRMAKSWMQMVLKKTTRKKTISWGPGGKMVAKRLGVFSPR